MPDHLLFARTTVARTTHVIALIDIAKERVTLGPLEPKDPIFTCAAYAMDCTNQERPQYPLGGCRVFSFLL